MASPLSVTGLARIDSVPPFGMASLALTARLMMASSSSPGSTRTAQTSSGTSTLISMSARSERISKLAQQRQPLRQIDDLRRQRLLARIGQQLPRQAFAALGRGGDHVEQPRHASCR